MHRDELGAVREHGFHLDVGDHFGDAFHHIGAREEVFKGKFADQAPDIMMVPNEGYSLTHAKSSIEDADWVSGDHRLEGVIVAAGPNVRPFEQPPALIDMAPTFVAASMHRRP